MLATSRIASALVFAVLILKWGAGGAAAQAPSGEGGARAGKNAFRVCQPCHALDAHGTVDTGPTLYGLFGRKVGTQDKFAYSDAMRDSPVVWSSETLDMFLKNPQGYLPGNKMPFGAVSKAEQRALLIAYLKDATAPK